jgi:hypothetical protein
MVRNEKDALTGDDEAESTNSPSAQRARLLGAFAMRLPMTTELARRLDIPNLAVRLQELRKLGWPIQAFRGAAKTTAGRRVAVFGLYPPLMQARRTPTAGSDGVGREVRQPCLENAHDTN